MWAGKMGEKNNKNKNKTKRQVESNSSGRCLCTAERLAWGLITCLCALIGSWGGKELTWGEGCQRESIHRLPVWGEWPRTVNQSAQHRQSCLQGVHLLHWQPTLHWGKERTRCLPHLHSLEKVERGEWVGRKGREGDMEEETKDKVHRKSKTEQGERKGWVEEMERLLAEQGPDV